MTAQTRHISRRAFLKTGAAAAAASGPFILPSRVIGEQAPSKTITLGFVGMGGQGMGRNLGTFLQQKDARVLAVCDVRAAAALHAKVRVDKAQGTTDCATYADFRELVARDDIDAVVISTPDHWHVPISMAALRAGKDVFCEKPSLTIAEGRELVREADAREAVFQWGIEDRSLIKYYRLAGWARSGAIGTVTSVAVTLTRKRPFRREAPAPVPKDLDWNLWLGPAPLRPYSPNRTAPQSWRAITDYSGGSLTDWGAHLVDTAQVGIGMDHSGPIEVGGTTQELDPAVYDSPAPVGYALTYRYANNVTMTVKDGPVDIRFVGTDGWVRCKGWNSTWSASNPEILGLSDFSDVAGLWPRPPIEHRDFLDAVASRTKPAYHAEAGHRLASTLHLGHLALRTGRTIRWDPATETFPGGDAQAEADITCRRAARDWSQA